MGSEYKNVALYFMSGLKQLGKYKKAEGTKNK